MNCKLFAYSGSILRKTRKRIMARKGSKKSHCKRGHELSGDNLYVSPQGIRHCRACRADYSNQHPQNQSIEYQRAARARWRKKNPEYHKNHWLMRKYGLTREEYDRMLRNQNQQCAICERLMSEPHVDHDHETEKIRDLLCHNCNITIGLLYEDVLIAKKVVTYLEKWKKDA